MLVSGEEMHKVSITGYEKRIIDYMSIVCDKRLSIH